MTLQQAQRTAATEEPKIRLDLFAGGVYKGWSQFNIYTANNTRINGDNTQFNRGNNMANKWYRIVADIDLENQIITTTLYDRDWKTGDAGSYILNKNLLWLRLRTLTAITMNIRKI